MCAAVFDYVYLEGEKKVENVSQLLTVHWWLEKHNTVPKNRQNIFLEDIQLSQNHPAEPVCFCDFFQKGKISLLKKYLKLERSY